MIERSTQFKSAVVYLSPTIVVKLVCPENDGITTLFDGFARNVATFRPR